jgi:hypothetical protein
MDTFLNVIGMLLGGGIVIYIAARLISAAVFRSKIDYDKRKEIENGRQNKPK